MLKSQIAARIAFSAVELTAGENPPTTFGLTDVGLRGTKAVPEKVKLTFGYTRRRPVTLQ